MEYKILAGIIVILVLIPFCIFVVSKVQMLGWLSALRQLKKEERKNGKEG